MRYLQQYEEVERQIPREGNASLGTGDHEKVSCLGKFFAKLANVLPLQEGDYDCLQEAARREDVLLLAAASMRPAKRNSAGFPVLFEAVCGYAKIDGTLAQMLKGAIRDQELPSTGNIAQAVDNDLDI